MRLIRVINGTVCTGRNTNCATGGAAMMVVAKNWLGAHWRLLLPHRVVLRGTSCALLFSVRQTGVGIQPSYGKLAIQTITWLRGLQSDLCGHRWQLGEQHVALTLIPLDDRSDAVHSYCAWRLDEQSDWRSQASAEYRRLRTASPTPRRNIVSTDGLTVIDTTTIDRRLRNATIPRRRRPRLSTANRGRPENFDTVRSDFGETLAAMLLSQEWGTKFGYQAVRDRETIHLPGRGIDIVGVELPTASSERLRLILGEVKVSSDRNSPPSVVDTKEDGLAKQHLAHLREHQVTSEKLWNTSRMVVDVDIRDRFLEAALYFEDALWDHLDVVCCAILVRPKGCYNATDFGNKLTSPDDYRPALIRFCILCISDTLDSTVDAWLAEARADETPETQNEIEKVPA